MIPVQGEHFFHKSTSNVASQQPYRTSSRDVAPQHRQYPAGSSPDSNPKSSALERAPSPDVIFRRGRTCNDPDVMRNPVRIINSDVFTFLESGRISGPAHGSNAGYVHDYDDVIQADSGGNCLRVLSASWGDFVRPISITNKPFDRTPFTAARLLMSPNRNYVDDPITSKSRPAPFSHEQLRLKTTTFQPDIILHGKVHYPDLEYRRDGPGGTTDFEHKSVVKNFSVRVPLEYAIRRPIGRSANAGNSPR